MRELINDEMQYYEVGETRYGRTCYDCVEEISISNWRKSIAEMSPSRELIIHSLFLLIEAQDSRNGNEVPFDRDITISIMQRTAYAASDASVKDSSIGEYWILADEHKRFKKEQILYHKQWNNNSSGVAEVLVLLELL